MISILYIMNPERQRPVRVRSFVDFIKRNQEAGITAVSAETIIVQREGLRLHTAGREEIPFPYQECIVKLTAKTLGPEKLIYVERHNDDPDNDMETSGLRAKY